MLLGYRGADLAVPVEYGLGWREASAANVVIPRSAMAVGMFGFSRPECSPVTSALADQFVRPLLTANASSRPISWPMLDVPLAGVQLEPLEPAHEIPGSVAVGNVAVVSG